MLRIQMETIRRSPISFERAWGEADRKTERAPRMEQQQFRLSSESFPDGGTIPDRFAEAAGISPQLTWSNAPPGTQSFVIIMDDPDAKQAVGHTFVHWVVALPASRSSLEEGASAGGWAGRQQALRDDMTSTPYRGPKPPSGTHRYYIAVYAMKPSFADKEFEDLAHSKFADDTRTYTRERFESRYHSDINAKAEITGLYSAKTSH
ncbi:MAG TPA: YbhB/YbcL family Raf kinase inhibitor-like protein [Gammaproteobacteria bacterium]|nr:YbhB/YbcL family Raf kinase inhibitor-like protein [Gammaproteobacteria bacterium]